MRRRLLVLVLALVIAGAAPAVAKKRAPMPGGCPVAPCVIEATVPLPASTNFGRIDARVRILLPAQYDGRRRLPVLYLLHGAGDTYKTWVDNTDVETFAARLGVIVVMPDGGHTPDSGWYSDWADGSRKWESFHIGVLIPWVDRTFATSATRQHRAVAGLSMGGFGATSYAGRHPDLFGAVASFSGALDTQMYGPAEAVGFAAVNPYFGTPDSRVWGDGTTDGAEWAAHNPAALARAGKLKGLGGNLWLTTGTGTPGGPAGDDPNNPGGYAVEQFVWQTNQSFELALAQSGTAYHDLSYAGGLHTGRTGSTPSTRSCRPWRARSRSGSQRAPSGHPGTPATLEGCPAARVRNGPRRNCSKRRCSRSSASSSGRTRWSSGCSCACSPAATA